MKLFLKHRNSPLHVKLPKFNQYQATLLYVPKGWNRVILDLAADCQYTTNWYQTWKKYFVLQNICIFGVTYSYFKYFSFSKTFSELGNISGIISDHLVKQFSARPCIPYLLLFYNSLTIFLKYNTHWAFHSMGRYE